MVVWEMSLGPNRTSATRFIAALPVLIIALAVAGRWAGAADIRLAWDAPVGAGLAGYKLYRGTSSHSYSAVTDVGNVTETVVAGLPEGTWYFAVTAYNESRIETGFSNEVTVSIAAADTSSPLISGVNSSNVTSGSATLTWTTNEVSDSQVEYGPSAAYGFLTVPNGAMTTWHSQALSGLTASTTYHYRVRSRDTAGNLAVSADFTFTTAAPPDTAAPAISAVRSSSATASSATITWTTNEAANGQVEYGASSAYGLLSALNSTMATSHSQGLSGLTASTTYHYRVRSRDAAGNLAVSIDYTFTTAAPPDTTPPAISAVRSLSVTASSATITWTTNEAANGQVEYGVSAAYGLLSALNGTMATSHSQALSGLTASTTYHYRVRSRDAAGNLSVSTDFAFATGATPDTAPPVISGVAATNVTGTTATIGWTTDEPATTQVEYGLTVSYGLTSGLDAALVTRHSAALDDLAFDTTYHYRVRSRDSSGNLSVSGDFTFSTGSGGPDILWRSTSTGQNLIWHMDGTRHLGGEWIQDVSDPDWKMAGVGDFDRDGKADILWRNAATGENYLWYMDGARRIGGIGMLGVPDPDWRVAGIADFSGDEKADILWRNVATGECYIWFMDGVRRIGESWIEGVPDLSWGIAGVSDCNADGEPDILWRNSSTGDNYWWFMAGTSRIGGEWTPGVSDLDWRIAGIADFSGDGRPDLLWRNSTTGENYVWFMNGTECVGGAWILGVSDPDWQVAPQTY